MTRVFAARVRLPGGLAALAVLAAGGCTPDEPQPEPTAQPAPHYLPVPWELCARIDVEEIAERSGLDVAPWYEPSTDEAEFGSLSYLGCIVGFVDEGERFAPVRGFGDFSPGGRFTVTIYPDPEKAQASAEYRGELDAFMRQWPDSPATAIQGWWDEGTSVETVDPIPQGTREEDPHGSFPEVTYFIHHENLYLFLSVKGTTVNSEVDDAFPILHGIADALTEEIKSHLTLAGSG